VAALADPQVPELLGRGHSQLLEPDGLRLQRRPGDARVRRTPPERQRLGQQATRLGRFAAQPVVCRPDEVGEPPGVDLVGGHVQGVSARVRTQPLSRPPGRALGIESAPQPGDVGLERGLDPRRRVLAPYLVDEMLHRDGSAVRGDEQSEQRAGLGPAEIGDPLADDHLEVAEHLDTHGGDPKRTDGYRRWSRLRRPPGVAPPGPRPPAARRPAP
jgi:hypothetical protein